MAALSPDRHAALGQLVERCADADLPRLAAALRGVPGPNASALGVLLADEVRDRQRRFTAFRPLLPLFRPRADGVEALTFPATVLPRLWRVASAREPALLLHLDGATPEAVAVADRLCQTAAAVVRDQPEAIWPAGGEDEDGRAGALAELAGCLDLAHLARRSLSSLDIWLGRPDGDRLAELRLLIRDSAAIAPDGATRMMEILFAHVEEAGLVLRLVTRTSEVAAREHFLSDSEMSRFVDRLIAAVGARAERIAAFRASAGLSQLPSLRMDVAWCASVLGELDRTVQLRPTTAWGEAAGAARDLIGAKLAHLLQSAEAAVDAALPMAQQTIHGRMRRTVARLDGDPAGDAAEAAQVLATLAAAVRPVAGVFGCEAERTRRVRAMCDRAQTFADQGLEQINGGEVEDEAGALALVGLAADLLVRLEQEEPARTIRRRLAVAGRTAPQGSRYVA